jgi:hypothetical protein
MACGKIAFNMVTVSYSKQMVANMKASGKITIKMASESSNMQTATNIKASGGRAEDRAKASYSVQMAAILLLAFGIMAIKFNDTSFCEAEQIER